MSATNPAAPEAAATEQLRKALRAIKELRARAEAAEGAANAPIAIVGLAMRFPGGADSPEKLWTLLRDGVDAITEVPSERWDIDAFYDADPAAAGKMSTRHGGFIAGADQFDAAFFGVSPREAEHMDPQHRILLETTWEAIERAGIAADTLAGTPTGVFLGISNQDYTQLLAARGLESIDPYVGSGNAHSVAAGRLSYTLGLHGPALAIDTACSSSLVAVHLAAQSLRAGECELALAAGVNLLLSPLITVNHSRARMLAPDGRCKTFDAAADGFIRSDGCGVVVLKKLSAAERDGDRILAVLRGSAVNQDGRTSGLTVPSGPAQQAVIRAALRQAGVAPADVDYVEAHGTGTALGDPIELGALEAVFGVGRSKVAPLRVGSIKTNLGHLESAAGIAGLIKAVLALQRREIPPHLHFKTPNPLVPWADLAFEIPTQPTAWPARTAGGPRLAGVSSFGFGGTNAHVILSEAPPTSEVPAPSPAATLPLLLSARTEPALRAAAARYADFLKHTTESWADICHTAATGRATFKHRVALFAKNPADAQAQLERIARGENPPEAAMGVVGENAPAQQSWTAGAGKAAQVRESAARAWVRGAPVAWRSVWAGERARRVDLPTYPFQRRRYWFEERPGASGAPAIAPAPAYVVDWETQPSRAPDAAVTGTWCVLGDGAALAAELRRLGAKLTDDVAAANRGVVFCASGTADDWATLQSIVRTARAPARLWVVTRGAVAGMNPDAAATWAAAKVVALEHPEFHATRIDLAGDELTAALASEVLANLPEDDVRLRGAERLVARLQPHALPAGGFRAKSDGTYLVTGGLGALGLRVAGWLVERGARHLLLLGRRAPSPQAEAELQRWRAQGVSVTVRSVDIADRAALAAVVQSSPVTLRGVFHAAGVAGYEPLATLTDESWRAVLRPKVEGARWLDELTAVQTLDAFVLFSSIASVWGSKGQAHYAAANGWLDALAQRRRAQGRPALSVSWGPWAGGGMATPEAAALLEASGVRLLNPVAALAALESALTGERVHVTVASVDWPRFRQVYELRGPRSLLARLAPGKSETSTAVSVAAPMVATLRALPAAERLPQLRTHVQQALAQILKLPAGELPDARQGFADLGVDSLMAIELKNRLTSELGVTLSATVAFDYPDAERLARHLEMRLAPAEKPAAASGASATKSMRPAVGATQIGELSDAEVETLLLKKLEQL